MLVRPIQRVMLKVDVASPLFVYCSSLSRGLNSTQFHVFRDNYLLRTRNTIPSVAKVALAAARHRDYPTLSSIARNLYEETGEGVAKDSHTELLTDCFNTHGRVVFDLPPVSLDEVNNSPVLLPETYTFLRQQDALYESEDYLSVLAASYAQELAADGMLRAIRDSLFLPYRSRYTGPDDWQRVSRYFDVHLNGLEEAHGEMARKAVEDNCKSEKDHINADNAAQAFLIAQSTLWGALHRRMHECETP